ncbi:MAG TPA: ATP-binding cassette domain-containing protein [Gemmatimonadaceae bacterium]|nr:ATP-binding cassette domain-containing protein [Gemmatimonadaceae bacterium]HRQ78134.1 ATP-binding cassette domain-containing protein [Gemmatimonadaceae bacterium]
MSDAFVTAAGLVKRYGTARAVAGVDLTLHSGRVVGIAGPNGSGKSTLARLLLGFTTPDGGSVTVGGLGPSMYRQRNGVGFVREDGARGFDRITPRELLALRTDPSDPSVAAVGEALKLAALMDRPIGVLSKGQWRICQLWYALSAQPKFIVLDEAEAGLDPAALERLSNAVRAAAANGAAVLMLSHHLDQMALTADTLLFMARGSLQGSVDPAGRSAAELRAAYSRLVEEA